MNKIVEILQSYITMMNPTDEEKMLGAKRLEVCKGCDHWKENAAGLHRCVKCGCQTKAKVFSPLGSKACPENKWKV